MDDEGKARIFLVEEDDETRPLLKSNLEREGFRVLLALDEQDARDRVRGERFAADLILVNLVGAEPEEALDAGRRIREYAKLDVPLVVMAEKYGMELEGTDVNASVNMNGNDWITYLEDHEQLKKLISRLLEESSK